LTVQTLGVVLGILVGLELARTFGVGMAPPSESLPFGSLPAQFGGAVLVAIAVAVTNGAGFGVVAVSALLGTVAWAGFAAASAAGLEQAPASFVGALIASVIGALVAHRLHVPSVAVTTAAILPLVPGAAVFRGLLGVIDSGGEIGQSLDAATSLITAGMVGIALAAGATLGLFVGSPLGRTIDGLRVSRRGSTAAAAAPAGRMRVAIRRGKRRETPPPQ
ncbi:MAG: threonine/serine exporter family protein, partial [Pseudoclavibacter sp.]